MAQYIERAQRAKYTVVMAPTFFSEQGPVQTKSGPEAEIVAAIEAAREVMWLKRLLNGIVGLEGIPEILLTMKRLFDQLRILNITKGRSIY